MQNSDQVLFSVRNEQGDRIFPPKGIDSIRRIPLGRFMLATPEPRPKDRPNPEKDKNGIDK